MVHDTAGDPMTGLKWTRRTTEKIAAELKSEGISVSPNTVGRILKKLGYSLMELVGNFKNNGATWEKAPVAVHDHDFRSMGKGVAVPYGN